MTAETLEQRIMRHEGFTCMPKPDAKGMYEIGFGHDLTPDECHAYPAGISEIDAVTLLETDIAHVKFNAAKAFPWLLGLDDARADVIIEMCYQIGVDGVAKFHNMISAIRIGNYGAAAKEMLNSEWDIETRGRCEELANIMLKG